MLETLEEVSFQSSYLLTIFLPFFSFSFLLYLHFFKVLTMCFHGCNSLVNVKRRDQNGMSLSIRLLTSVNYCSSLRFLLVFPLLMSFVL